MGAIVRRRAFESLIGFEQMYCTRKGRLLFPRLLLFILVLVEYKLQLCLCLHKEPFKHITLLISPPVAKYRHEDENHNTSD